MAGQRKQALTRVTMTEVAMRAGVSPMTVSRTLRDPGAVTDDLRRKVVEAVRATGYIHDRVASALASQKSGIVAVVLPTIASSMFSDTIQGIAEVARSKGLQIVMAETDYSLSEEERAVAALLGRRPDGVIIIGVVQSRRIRKMLEGGRVPVVETWDITLKPIDTLVAFSNADAAAAMTDALVASGRRRIAFATSSRAGRRAAARESGYRSALAKRDDSLPIVIAIDDFTTMASGREVADRLLATDFRPDAVFCVNDVVAAGTMLELQRRGVLVPKDIAVAGFGGFDFARFLNPSLTTVNVPRHEIGRLAATAVIARAEGRAHKGDVLSVGFEIVPGGST